MVFRIKLFLLNLRDMIVTAGPLLMLVVGLLVAAYWWLDPQPPTQVRLAVGPQGSADAAFGARYAKALAREGITVQLVPTQGSLDNLQLLREGKVDVAFVRGGSSVLTRAPQAVAGAPEPLAAASGPASAVAAASTSAAAASAPVASASEPGTANTAANTADDPDAGLQSLGALYYDPLWLFYRDQVAADVLHQAEGKRARAAQKKAPPGAAQLQLLTQLRGLRVNVDQTGSGVPALMNRMLRLNGMSESDLTLSHLPPDQAAAALLAGDIDVAVMTGAPQSSVVRALLRAPGVQPMDLAQAEAYARRNAFMRTVTLPRGVADLAADIPPHDVSLLAATTALLTREDTHPALRQLFAQAAQDIHSRSGWLNEAREFPNTRTSELPVSAEGNRAINGKPPFWQRYLPFWAGNVIERMWLVIGGLIVLVLPLSRVVPPLYTFRVRRRVFRWYARLREVEARANAGSTPREQLLRELDELDRVANGIAVPLAHANEVYALRNNIHATRKRLLSKAADASEV
jgi:TRAP-type uncharacterized transport system substrate-binding protein